MNAQARLEFLKQASVLSGRGAERAAEATLMTLDRVAGWGLGLADRVSNRDVKTLAAGAEVLRRISEGMPRSAGRTVAMLTFVAGGSLLIGGRVFLHAPFQKSKTARRRPASRRRPH
jgi:hypothetical protein